MKVQINNITFNFTYQASDLVPDKENLGLGHLIMPGKMANRFAKEFGGIPHYDTEESTNARKYSDHECYNSDTNIVLMHWLFEKRRKYSIPYSGLDPFWLFHDSLHAKHDVWCGEVQVVYSTIEKERLVSGADYAFKNGVNITADTVLKIVAEWENRWRYRGREGKNFESLEPEYFLRFMSDEDKETTEFYLEFGPEEYLLKQYGR